MKLFSRIVLLTSLCTILSFGLLNQQLNAQPSDLMLSAPNVQVIMDGFDQEHDWVVVYSRNRSAVFEEETHGTRLHLLPDLMDDEELKKLEGLDKNQQEPDSDWYKFLELKVNGENFAKVPGKRNIAPDDRMLAIRARWDREGANTIIIKPSYTRSAGHSVPNEDQNLDVKGVFPSPDNMTVQYGPIIYGSETDMSGIIGAALKRNQNYKILAEYGMQYPFFLKKEDYIGDYTRPYRYPAYIQMPGKTMGIALYAWGMNVPYELSVYIEDCTEQTFRIDFGTLNFSGWRNLIAPIPDHIYFSYGSTNCQIGPRLLYIKLEAPTRGHTGPFFAYFDDLRYNVDMERPYYDGRELETDETGTSTIWNIYDDTK